jgi:hypothetical protein
LLSQVIVPKTYLKNPPTTNRKDKKDNKPVIVTQRVNILNIDRIDTVNMMFALTMEVSFEWKDHRCEGKQNNTINPPHRVNLQAKVQEPAGRPGSKSGA